MIESKDTSHLRVFWVKNLYVYIISIVAIIMMSIGIFGIVKWTVKVSLFDKYVLEQYEEDRCIGLSGKYGAMQIQPDPVNSPKRSEAEIAQERADCEKSLENNRRYRKVMDLAEGLSQLLIGGLLYYTHFVVLRKKWEM